MKWTEIAGREPALGTVLHDRLIKPGVVLVGTTRRDGSARISGGSWSNVRYAHGVLPPLPGRSDR